MTPLTKAVRRVTRRSYPVLYVSEARPIVVSLEPGDVITFREKRCRLRFSLPIESAFKYAVRLHVLNVAREKKLAKKRTGLHL